MAAHGIFVYNKALIQEKAKKFFGKTNNLNIQLDRKGSIILDLNSNRWHVLSHSDGNSVFKICNFKQE